ncbi:hypothetical protein Cni_G14907 [Canna indica]|uniref:LOB domain-containing protein n=1 Tax=Canna indica TaxID=4628 RepID=A0AAQ3KCU3_9LILI|nr:hypothetical protein Cni_G14907 [Canna indica]
MANSGSCGAPCGACKFLRRKCPRECVFAPYFRSEHGAARFAAIHKVFGASNASKLLLHVPQADRCEAVVTIAYEAQARLRDPVYGCVGRIFALQQQVASLQLQLMQIKGQIAQWQGITTTDDGNPNLLQAYSSSLESMSSSSSHTSCNLRNNQEYNNYCGNNGGQDVLIFKEESSNKRWISSHHADQMGELQDVAFKMIGNL